MVGNDQSMTTILYQKNSLNAYQAHKILPSSLFRQFPFLITKSWTEKGGFVVVDTVSGKIMNLLSINTKEYESIHSCELYELKHNTKSRSLDIYITIFQTFVYGQRQIKTRVKFEVPIVSVLQFIKDNLK